MKNLSKFHMILLVIFGALGIAGVLVFALAVGSGNSNAVGTVVIWGTLDQNAFDTILRQAAEANSDLSHVKYQQKDPATFEDDLTNVLAAGEGPDLFVMRSDYAVKDFSKVLPISYSAFSQSQYRSTFITASEAFLAPSGIAALPLVSDPLVLYWNRDLLGTAGYSNPPQYWGDVIPMATFVTGGDNSVNGKAITRRDNSNAIQKSAISFGEYTNIPDAKDILSTLIMQAGGNITAMDAGASHLVPALASGVSVNSSQSSESALQFYTEFADPSQNVYSWSRALPNAQAAFSSGDLGLYIGHASEELYLKRKNPNLNFAVAPLPQLSGGSAPVDTAITYGFAISKQSHNLTGALTVEKYLSAADISKKFSVALGIPSARRDVLAATTAQDEDAVKNRQVLISKYWIDPDPEKTSAVFQSMIEDTVNLGASHINDAVLKANQEIGHILGI